MSHYQKIKTNLDITKARDSEWQCHQLEVCTSFQMDNHTGTSQLGIFALPAAQPVSYTHLTLPTILRV